MTQIENSSSQAVMTSSPEKKRVPSVLFLMGFLLIGLTTALGAYVFLPALGIEFLQSQLGLKKLIALFVVPVAVAAYLYYWQLVQKHPVVLVTFMAVFWMPVSYVSEQLLLTGINLHLRALLILALLLPSFWITLRYFFKLSPIVPSLKWSALFTLGVGAYYFFNNASNISDGFGISVQSASSVGLIQFESYIYCFLAIVLTAVVFLIQPKQSIALFDRFNKVYLLASILLALIVIAGYPTGLTSMMLDGFRRAFGLFTHPNPFAHSMGVQVLYLLGISAYYSVRNKSNAFRPFSESLLWIALIVNTVAFLLALSKTAIAFAVLGVVVFTVLNASSKAFQKIAIRLLFIAIVILPFALIAYSLLTGNSFTDVIQSRMEETTSMDWRSQVWDYIIDNFSLNQLFLGNGFTASNMLIYQMTYNNIYNTNPLIMVHNGYLSLLYDMGVMGCLLFIAALASAKKSLSLLARVGNESRMLLSGVVVLTVYFLGVSGFDEMTYMFNAPLLFWIFSTAMFSLAVIHQQIKKAGGFNASH